MRVLLLLLGALSAAALGKDYRVNVIETARSDDERRMIEHLISRLYAPLNITPSYTYYPTKRGLKLANVGDIDAVAGRIEVAAQPYKNLVKVEEPIFMIRGAIFCLRPGDCGDKEGAAIGALKGMISAYAFCETRRLSCTFENTRGSMARLLSDELVSGLLLYLHEAVFTACQIPNRILYYRLISTLQLPVYHYVHKRHHKLLPALNASMRFLTSEGYATPIDRGMAAMEACGKVLVEVQS